VRIGAKSDGAGQLPETALLKNSPATATPSAFPTFPAAGVRLKLPPVSFPEACPVVSRTAIIGAGTFWGTPNSAMTPRQVTPEGVWLAVIGLLVHQRSPRQPAHAVRHATEQKDP